MTIPAIGLDALPTIEPLEFAPEMGGAENWYACALSPDGASIFVPSRHYAINLWHVVSYRWPEVLGIAIAVAAFLLLRAVLRARAHPQLVGKPHCRKCNYCLEAAPSDRCPECGTLLNKRRIVVGRSVRRRALPRAIALTALLAVAAAAKITQLPRDFAGDWFELRSFGLLDWAEKHNRIHLVQGHTTEVTKITEFDARTGSRVREVAVGHFAGSTLDVVANGTLLFGTSDWTSESTEAVLLRVSDGAVVRRLKLKNVIAAVSDDRVRAEVSVSPDGQSALFVVPTIEAKAYEFRRWRFATGELESLPSAPASWELRPSAGRRLRVHSSFRITPDGRLLEYAPGPRPPGTIRLRDPQRDNRVVFEKGPPELSSSSATCWGDPLRVSGVAEGNLMTTWDVASGDVVATLPFPGRAWVVSPHSYAFDETGARGIAVATRDVPRDGPSHSLYLVDLRANRWLARLATPRDGYLFRASVSANGARALVHWLVNGSQPRCFVYDLTTVGVPAAD